MRGKVSRLEYERLRMDAERARLEMKAAYAEFETHHRSMHPGKNGHKP
jgi:hypothetical protein